MKKYVKFTIVTFATLPLFAYVYFMFLNPFINGDWNSVLKVWSAWQSFNVGVLAFVSSLIAFYISRYNAEQQRKREFVAAKAFLPESLSELCSYFKKSAVLYIEAYKKALDEKNDSKTNLISTLPNLPKEYKSVFSKCIRTAKPDVGEHLAYILTRLQVHHARLESEHSEFNPDSIMAKNSNEIMVNIYCLGELQALVNRTYPFARDTGKLIFSSLTQDEFFTAYCNLDIETEKIDGLAAFTIKACDKGNK
jgi:hypothetical protein